MDKYGMTENKRAFESWIQEEGYRINPEGLEYAIEISRTGRMPENIRSGLWEWMDGFSALFGQ